MLDDANEMEKYTQLNDQSMLAIKWYVVLLFYPLINTYVFIFYFVHDVQCVPTSMIPDAVFREFLAKTLRKLRFRSETTGSVKNSTRESSYRIRLPVLTGFCRFLAEPDKSVHRNTASMKSPEDHGTDRFRAGLFDMGIYIYQQFEVKLLKLFMKSVRYHYF
jgi:hypothetical protein